MWLLSLTQVIVLPVLTAGVVAAVASPRWPGSKARNPARAGAALLMLGIIALGVGMTLVVVGGITGQTSAISRPSLRRQGTIVGWLKDLGMDPAPPRTHAGRQLGDQRQRFGAA